MIDASSDDGQRGHFQGAVVAERLVYDAAELRELFRQESEGEGGQGGV